MGHIGSFKLIVKYFFDWIDGERLILGCLKRFSRL